MMPGLRISTHEGIFVAGMALMLGLFSVGVIGATGNVTGQAPLQLHACRIASGTSGPEPGDTLRLPGGGIREVAARMQFSPAGAGPAAIALGAVAGARPVDAVWVQGQGPDGTEWRSATLDFFDPVVDHGIMPTSFIFPLPSTWQGDVTLDLHVRGTIRAALRPRLLRENAAMQLEHRAVALNFAVYAGLFMLALIALVLYWAARERSFLAAFGCALASLLLLGAVNGHMFQLPGLSILAAWRAQAIWALALLFSASVVHLLLRYADLRDGLTPATHVLFDRYCIALIVLAAVCLLDLQVLQLWTQPLATGAWLGAGMAGIWVMVDARRRQVPMSGAILLLVLMTVLAALALEAMSRGHLPDSLWTRYGYQLVLVVTLTALTLGLLSRIGEYREQRDRHQLARADTERRMGRESARTNLTLELQKRLRGLEPADIEWSAFHLLLEHLLPQVSAELAVAMARGYHGRDALVVAPAEHKPELQEILSTRALVLKRLAMQGTPLQQPLPAARARIQPRTEAVIPLPIRAPGWGVVLLQREGSDGFSNEEMALASEFARLTVLHADEALAALQLRRSAELDALTGTFNRRTIDHGWGAASPMRTREAQSLSIVFIDIDHFKAINDRYGHACGDHCLREVALALRSALGEGDVLGRYGGEEFVATLPGRGGADARAMAEHLRTSVEHCDIQWQGQVLHLTVSIGLAMRLPSESTSAATVERADKALYTAKRSGRNCVHVAPAVFS